MSYQFQGQRQSEEVLLITRQHPFILFHRILIAVLVALVAIAAWIFLQTGPVVFWVFIACLGSVILLLWIGWYSWNHTLVLLTNERLVFLEQRGLFQRKLVECTLPSIQQVEHDVSGIWRTILGYGSLSLYASGSQKPIIIPEIPDPYNFQQELLRIQAGEGEEFLESSEPAEVASETEK